MGGVQIWEVPGEWAVVDMLPLDTLLSLFHVKISDGIIQLLNTFQRIC